MDTINAFLNQYLALVFCGMFGLASLLGVAFVVCFTERDYRKKREENRILTRENRRLKRSNAQYQANGRRLSR